MAQAPSSRGATATRDLGTGKRVLTPTSLGPRSSPRDGGSAVPDGPAGVVTSGDNGVWDPRTAFAMPHETMPCSRETTRILLAGSIVTMIATATLFRVPTKAPVLHLRTPTASPPARPRRHTCACRTTRRRPIPALLSQTGAFDDVRTLTPTAGLVPYDLNVPFWSDGAAKLRWVALPGGGPDAAKVRLLPHRRMDLPRRHGLREALRLCRGRIAPRPAPPAGNAAARPRRRRRRLRRSYKLAGGQQRRRPGVRGRASRRSA